MALCALALLFLGACAQQEPKCNHSPVAYVKEAKLYFLNPDTKESVLFEKGADYVDAKRKPAIAEE